MIPDPDVPVVANFAEPHKFLQARPLLTVKQFWR